MPEPHGRDGEAKDKDGKEKHGERPGWGHGDRNHEHTGPPGRGKRK